MCFIVPSSQLHEQAYPSYFSCGTCINMYEVWDVVVKIIIIVVLIFVPILVNELHKHAAPI